jgi:hypothetical protein
LTIFPAAHDNPGSQLGYYVGSSAADEIGISGHGASMPVIAKHAVSLIESRPADRPEPVCEKCGHQEEDPWQRHFRESYADTARARLAAHVCRTP